MRIPFLWPRKYRSSRSSASGGEKAGAVRNALHARLERNVEHLLGLFTDTPDLVVRPLTLASGELAAVVYMDGLSDKNAINNNILRPLMGGDGPDRTNEVPVGRRWTLRDWGAVEAALLHGSCLLFVDGRPEATGYGTEGWPQRAIEDPQMEASIKGAHQGFVESISQNVALIRRYLPSRELKFKSMTVGRRGRTAVSIAYLADVVHPDHLRELEDRIGRIDIDIIINTGELAELIEDNPFSPFPQLLLTERPDAAVSQLSQGRLVVLVDRSPSVIVAPASFVSFFQAVDDYSVRWSIASFIRLLRFFAFGVAILLPAFYIASISYNFELIPLRLLLTIGEYRGSVPFPPFFEAVFMEITLEMMREAGIRLPAPVGQTVGIVGGIVIGQAVVQAGLISNIMVIVVAFTAISSFILPNFDMVAAARLIRFALMIAAAMFGIFGIMIGVMILIAHAIALESLGSPFGSPFAPVRLGDWKDAFVRLPLWFMRKRPEGANPTNLVRQGNNRGKRDGSS